MTMTLTEFLWARFAEDETLARHDPNLAPLSRVLVECKAKRTLILRASSIIAAKSDLIELLSPLAWPYADHPDYRQEWKP